MPTDSAKRRTIGARPPQGFIGRAAARAGKLLCGLRGHDSLLHFQEGRISLMCVLCGHETPGWDVGTVPARREQAGRSQLIVRLPLVGQRRAA